MGKRAALVRAQKSQLVGEKANEAEAEEGGSMLGLTGQDLESTLPFPGLPQLVGSPQKTSRLKPGLLGFLHLIEAHLLNLSRDPMSASRARSPTSSGSRPLRNVKHPPTEMLVFTPGFLLPPGHSARARIWLIFRPAPRVPGTRALVLGPHSASCSPSSYAVERKIEPFYKGGKAQVTTPRASWDRGLGSTG